MQVSLSLFSSTYSEVLQLDDRQTGAKIGITLGSCDPKEEAWRKLSDVPQSTKKLRYIQGPPCQRVHLTSAAAATSSMYLFFFSSPPCTFVLRSGQAVGGGRFHHLALTHSSASLTLHYSA